MKRSQKPIFPIRFSHPILCAQGCITLQSSNRLPCRGSACVQGICPVKLPRRESLRHFLSSLNMRQSCKDLNQILTVKKSCIDDFLFVQPSRQNLCNPTSWKVQKEETLSLENFRSNILSSPLPIRLNSKLQFKSNCNQTMAFNVHGEISNELSTPLVPVSPQTTIIHGSLVDPLSNIAARTRRFFDIDGVTGK